MSEPESLILRIERVLPAPPAQVFAAWTDPAHVAEWMCPVSPSSESVKPMGASLDLRVGGRFAISMEHEGQVFTHRGEYLEIDPPNHLLFTWRIPLPSGEQTTRVTLNLRPHGADETEMELIHERLPDQDMVDRHEVGWSAIAERLSRHLESNDA